MGMVDSIDTKRRKAGPNAPIHQYYAGNRCTPIQLQRGKFAPPMNIPWRILLFKEELMGVFVLYL